MTLVLYIYLGLSIIFYNQCSFTNAKALIGENVRQAREREFPFVAAIIRKNLIPSDISRFCTGTLISNKDVITANHCLADENISNIQVAIGSIDYTLSRKYNLTWWISYNKWVEQRNTRKLSEANDIAIIRLSTFVTDDIKPAVLSTLSSSELYGLDVAIAGWGKSNNDEIPKIMETVNLKILPKEMCSDRIMTISSLKTLMDIKFLCSAATPAALVSEGDSGDPLLYNNLILGVSSGFLINSEFQPQKVNLHHRINYYKLFIQDIMKHF